jgi:hypothetical protein
MRVTTRQRSLGLFASLGLLVFWAGPAQAAPPGAATLVAPAGVVGGSTLTFVWQWDPGATFYYLQINDATAAPRLTRWYPAAQACPGGSATCLASVSTGFAVGAATWWVQTWSPDGFGPWSAGMSFTVRWVAGAWEQILPAAERFQLVMGGAAVLDRETGLVWQRILSASLTDWPNALGFCHQQTVDNRAGWRLPSMEELLSLLDPSRNDPALPAGHPFGGVSNTDVYWTATTVEVAATFAYHVLFRSFAYIGSASKTAPTGRRWCVRGGSSINNPF